MVLLSLNWQHLTEAIHQAAQMDPTAGVILTDAQGRWLLTERNPQLPPMSFGDDYAKLTAESWQHITGLDKGILTQENRLLRFQRMDMRRQTHQGLAGHIFSQDDTLPWVLGVSLPTLPGNRYYKTMPVLCGFYCLSTRLLLHLVSIGLSAVISSVSCATKHSSEPLKSATCMKVPLWLPLVKCRWGHNQDESNRA